MEFFGAANKSLYHSGWQIIRCAAQAGRVTPSMVTPFGKKQGLMLGNSERNCPLKPDSRHNSPGYAEPTAAIAHKAPTISKGQLRNDTASDKDRHNEAGWLHTHAAVNPNPLHPIEWKESEQTEDRISLILPFADN